MKIEERIPLAPRTTLGVGGPARFFVEARAEDEVAEAVAWAGARGLPLFVLGGGSNLLVSDEGFDGLVLRVRLAGLSFAADGAVEAGAGEAWDGLVEAAVARGFAGVECLSGIPGEVGATPIQNVGAYGQEVASTVVEVEALDRATGEFITLSNAACAFGYRDSVFKREGRDRYVVCRVRFQLQPGGAPTVSYAELSSRLASRLGGQAASLGETRAAVLELRRSKSMLLDPNDENGRSAGSFFMNPTVSPELAARVRAIAGDGPAFPTTDGRVKLSAGWLIERAGFPRGTRDGRVGLSTRHALAIVNLGGATSREVVAFARRVQAGVEQRFGVRLAPEPVRLGFASDEL